MASSKAKKRTAIRRAPDETVQPHAGTGEEFLHTHRARWNPQLRIMGQHTPLNRIIPQWQVAREAAVTPSLPLQATTSATTEDYAQLDLRLAVQATPLLSEEPHPGTSYAGFTPAQRYHFLQWQEEVTLPAPAAFRQLYLAHLETQLFDREQQMAAHQALCVVADSAAWRDEALLWRTLLLSFYLMTDGVALVDWLATNPRLPTPLLGVALGHLALRQQPLSVELLALLLQRWQLASQLPASAILQLRLAYLTEALGAEPLAHLRAQLSEDQRTPTAWRCAHRDLRLRLCQPDLRPLLTPLLRELATLTDTALLDGMALTGRDADEADDPMLPEERKAIRQSTKKQPWQLILEFGESRSDYFTLAINQAKRLPGYMQLMDENRRMIHRVRFEKSELRRFWLLWEYVQSWSSTQVYVNGKALQKWEIYPYSPYLR
jgi:hypothetical protein